MYSLTIEELKLLRSVLPDATTINAKTAKKLDVEIEYIDSLLQPQMEHVQRFNAMKQRIYECCEKKFKINRQMLFDKGRNRQMCYMRHAIVVIFYELGYTCSEATSVVGREHALAIYATKVHESMLNYDDYKNIYNSLKESINQ